ncbi:MAG: hypothetical protein HUU49_02350 [Candidatus Buchananbacteria bacterium]|nr:hypothetical protein [Candidatus Buchananbacteria bacterium]
MKTTAMMRCSHCGVPLQIEIVSGVMTITCSKCGKPSLVIVMSGGICGSVRLNPDIMIGSSAIRQTEHIRDQLVWFMRNHPEVLGLEDLVDTLTKKITESLQFSSQAEQVHFKTMRPINDADYKGFHRALLPDDLTFGELQRL